MTNRSQEFWRLINPVTDFPAVLAILLGLGIALFLDQAAIKLIGACVSILGVVALFLLFSQRTKDISMHATKPVSETTSFKTTVKQDPATKRLIFDDYAASFGGDEFPNQPPAAEEQAENDVNTPPTAPAAGPASPANAAQARPKTATTAGSGSIIGAAYRTDDTELDDSVEGFRIIDSSSKSDASVPVTNKKTQTEASQAASGENAETNKESTQARQNSGKTTTEIAAKETPEIQSGNKETDKTAATEPQNAETESSSPRQADETSQAATRSAQSSSQSPSQDTRQSTGKNKRKKKRNEQQSPQKQTAKPAEQQRGDTQPSNASDAETSNAQAHPISPLTAPDEMPAAAAKTAPATASHTPTPADLAPDGSAQSEAEDHAEQFSVGHKRKKLNIQLEEIFEEHLDSLRNEPRKEFDYLIKRVLMVIRSVISARTTMFLWVNIDKAEFVIETKISDDPETLIDKRKLAFGSDVVSQIAANGSPEILTEINPNAELDLLPYYSRAAGTRSFVGVPVYYNGMVWGVLTADTTEEDAYDTQTVGFLGHFTKLIGGLIQGYGEKYDLLQSARTMESIDGFRRLINDPNNTRNDICFALVDKLAPLIPHSILGVCIYELERQSWVIAELRMRNSGHADLNGEPVDLQNSLIGKAILAGETHTHNDIDPNIVRVSQHESPLDNATYTFVPIKSLQSCFGAVFIETPRSNELTRGDIQIIELLAEYAGSVLEQIDVSTVLQSNALIDESTGIPNFTAFRNRLFAEFTRARDQKLHLTLCLLSMDQYRNFASRINTEFAESCMHHVLEMLSREIRPYDLIGRVNDNTIGIGMIDADSRTTELWAERIRNKIASTILERGEQQFSVTVSVGLVEYAGHESLDAFLDEAESVLTLAAERSNSVVVYS